jgi:hypothetical protein
MQLAEMPMAIRVARESLRITQTAKSEVGTV